VAEILNLLEPRDFFANQQVAIFARPAARVRLGTTQIRLRKTAEPQKV
jgi:hypothetical protein